MLISSPPKVEKPSRQITVVVVVVVVLMMMMMIIIIIIIIIIINNNKFSSGLKQLGQEVSMQFHLVLTSRMSEAVPSLPHVP
jgi:hypothetical protein